MGRRCLAASARTVALVALVALGPVACGPDDYDPSADATGPTPPAPTTSASALPEIEATPSAGSPLRCSSAAPPLAYVWDVHGALWELDVATLSTRMLGVPACPTAAKPWSLSVSQGGVAYLMYDDWNVYALPLESFHCAPTPFSASAIGIVGPASIALGAERGADRLYAYGASVTPEVVVSDVSDYVPFVLGPVAPARAEASVDLKADAYGRLLGLSDDGVLSQMDPATGALVAEEQTNLPTPDSWALFTYGTDVLAIGTESGAVVRYDLGQKTLTTLGLTSLSAVAASAPACTIAAPSPTTATAAPPSFSAGDVWIGTYSCPAIGTADVALAVKAFDGTTIEAVFDFNWTPGHTVGSFSMTGTFDPNTRAARLTAGAWIDQPSPDWSTVNLAGLVNLQGSTYSGSVRAPGCGAFTLAK